MKSSTLLVALCLIVTGAGCDEAPPRRLSEAVPIRRRAPDYISIHLVRKIDDDNESDVPSSTVFLSLPSNAPSSMVSNSAAPATKATATSSNGGPLTLYPSLPVNLLPSHGVVPPSQIADSISPILHDSPQTVASSLPSTSDTPPMSSRDDSIPPSTTHNPNHPVTPNANLPSTLAYGSIDEVSYANNNALLNSPMYEVNDEGVFVAPHLIIASRPFIDAVEAPSGIDPHDSLPGIAPNTAASVVNATIFDETVLLNPAMAPSGTPPLTSPTVLHYSTYPSVLPISPSTLPSPANSESLSKVSPALFPGTSLSTSPAPGVALSLAHTDNIPLVWPVRESCSPSIPCGRCEGNCRRDTDCSGALICFYKDNGFLVVDSVPGCSGHDLASIDRCTMGTRHTNDLIPLLRPVRLYCSEEEPCGRCEGKCFHDVDCQDDLVCFLNEGGLPRIGDVPGCIGDHVVRSHWCIAAIAKSSSQQYQSNPVASKGPTWTVPSSSPSRLAQSHSPSLKVPSKPTPKQMSSYPTAPMSNVHINQNKGDDNYPYQEASKQKEPETSQTSKKSRQGRP